MHIGDGITVIHCYLQMGHEITLMLVYCFEVLGETLSDFSFGLGSANEITQDPLF